MPVSAATFAAGDLIKASGKAVYYYASNGKRYVFPHENVYFSWYTDFSSVKTITDSELASIMIGGNITMRPGTKLVKIQTDPKVYAVTKGGVLRAIGSEAVAKALYGDAWAKRVVDVDDTLFISYNSSAGSAITSNFHPDGSLLKYAADSNYYIMDGSMKRKIVSNTVMNMNGLNPANAILTTNFYANGADIMSRESLIADTVYFGSVTSMPIPVPTPTQQPGTLKIISDTQPISSQVVGGTGTWIPMAKYIASAQNEDISITRIGVELSASAPITDISDFTLVGIAKGGIIQGEVGISASSPNIVNIDISSNPILVQKNTSVTFQVWAKFASVVSTKADSLGDPGFPASGHMPSVSLQSVIAKGMSTGTNIPVNINDALTGNPMVLHKSIPILTVTSPSTFLANGLDSEILKFSVAVNPGGIIAWKQIVFKIAKPSTLTLTNLKLKRGNTDYDDSTVSVTTESISGDTLGSVIIVAFKWYQIAEVDSSVGHIDYTIHGIVSNSGSNGPITSQLYNYSFSDTPFIGWLMNLYGSQPMVVDKKYEYSLCVSENSEACGRLPASFIWSDESAVNSGSGPNGSRDWFSEKFMSGITDSAIANYIVLK